MLTSAMVSMIIGSIWHDKIKKNLYRVIMIVSKFSNHNPLKKEWKARFKHINLQGEKIEHAEDIELFMVSKFVVGIVVSGKWRGSLRLMGKIENSRYFTGNWYHPDKDKQYHGSFQLTIQLDNEHMNGKWAGFSSSTNDIQCDEWNWRR
jgi:hypothetical protein